jgi:hypothetical protein
VYQWVCGSWEVVVEVGMRRRRWRWTKTAKKMQFRQRKPDDPGLEPDDPGVSG